MNFLKNLFRQLLSQLRHYFLGLTRAGSHQTWMTVFVVGVGLVLFYLVYLATLVAPDLELVQEQFQRLGSSYENGNLVQFLRKKDLLRDEVKRTLRANHSPNAQIVAANISLYLFPDLLPDKDFQKEEALEAWAPLQKKIETDPGSYESRLAYEEMKAFIWNFENPDRSSPKLSDPARMVLEIYDRLSSQKRE